MKVRRIQRRKFFDKEAYGSNWEELKRRCKKRDGWTCKICGYRPPKDKRFLLHADHRIPLSKGGKNILINLITRCADCHRRKTNRTRPKKWHVSWTTNLSTVKRKAGKNTTWSKPKKLFRARKLRSPYRTTSKGLLSSHGGIRRSARWSRR